MHHLRRRRRSGEARAGRADRISDATRDRSPRQAHRGPHPAHQGFRSARESRRPRVRRMGHLRGQRVRSGEARGRPRSFAARQVARAARGAASDGGRLRSGIRAAHPRPQRQGSALENGKGRDADGGHPPVPASQRRRAHGDDLVRLDRGFPSRVGRASEPQALRIRPARERSGNRAESDLRLRGAQDGNPLRERRAESDH